MKSKAPLVLMEQMVMLAVFALAAAICLQAFVKSDQISRRGGDRDRAVLLCQSAAEVVRACGGNFNEAAELLDLEFGQGSTMYRYYDESWEPLPPAEGSGAQWAFCLTVQGLYPDVPGLGKAHVSVSERSGGALFELDVAWQEVAANAG